MREVPVDLLELSTIESRKLKIDPSELDVGALVARFVHDYEPRLKEREIEVEVRNPGGATAWADAGDAIVLEWDPVEDADAIVVLRSTRPGEPSLRVNTGAPPLGDPSATNPVWTSAGGTVCV